MKTYLSENPTWLKPTDTIRALNDNSIFIVEEAVCIPAHIRVSDADPKGEHSGLCCVQVWQASIDRINAEWSSGPIPPTARAHHWKRYLTKDAISLIQENKHDSMHGELLLEVPE